MVHQLRKIPTAYQMFIRKKGGMWMSVTEQRKYREDSLMDLQGFRMNPLFKALGYEATIKQVPARMSEIKERELLSKLGMSKRSIKRGILEGLKVEIS